MPSPALTLSFIVHRDPSHTPATTSMTYPLLHTVKRYYGLSTWKIVQTTVPHNFTFVRRYVWTLKPSQARMNLYDPRQVFWHSHLKSFISHPVISLAIYRKIQLNHVNGVLHFVSINTDNNEDNEKDNNNDNHKDTGQVKTKTKAETKIKTTPSIIIMITIWRSMNFPQSPKSRR